MTKTAIFVEGQTELIIIREFLLKWFEYNISLNCLNLFNKNELIQAEYNFPNSSADRFFLIINVGNDNAVLSRLIQREANLVKNGYSNIIALRDMYSLAYRKIVKNHTINQEVNDRFINQTNNEINERASYPKKIHFHFAIMEIETWLWGLTKVFQKIDTKLTMDYIAKTTNFNIEDDPEKLLFHPSKTLADLFQSVGKSYNKSKGDVSSFENHIEKQDYNDLYESNKCQMFNSFVNAIAK